jgi:hypothetical protein
MSSRLAIEAAKKKINEKLAARFEGKRQTAVAVITSVERDAVSGYTTGKVRATIDGLADQSVFVGAGTGVAVGESLRVENRAGGIGPEWVSLGKTGSVAGSEGTVDTGRPLSTPTSLALSSSTYASGTAVAARIAVEFDQIGDWEGAANYEIAYYRDSDGAANQHVSNAPHVNGQSAVQYAILSLLPGTGYSVKVRAVGYGGSLSSWTATGSITTATDASVPTTPTGLDASQVSDTALRFFWSRNTEADFSYYEIGVSSSAGTGGMLAGYPLSTGDTPEHIINVDPATNRYFRVRAIDTSGNAAAWSSWSGPHATVETTSGYINLANIIDTSYGLGIQGSGKIGIDLASPSGLEFSSGNLAVNPGTLITVEAAGVSLSSGSAQYQVPVTGATPFVPGWAALGDFAGSGLGFSDGAFVVNLGNGLEIDSDAVRVNQGYGFTWTGTHTFQADIQLDADLDFVGAQSITTTTGNLTISPAGDVVFDPAGNDILPATNYDLNIGALSKKYLTLHAAELWVETLVAQNTIATIGGRILVGPTTTLIADLAVDSPDPTTIQVKYNNLGILTGSEGSICYMEANNFVEFFQILVHDTPDSGKIYKTVTGGYEYKVDRNLDTTGQNQWYAGDAMFNTGKAGNGFIDLYSVQSMKPGVTQAGPSIVGNVRNSSTYNDWSEHWAVGNLNGLYGYGVDTYGFAAGKYASGQPWVSVDATNGFRINNYNTVVGQWATDGTWSIAGDGSHSIEWDLSALNIYGSLYVSQSLGAGGGGANGEDGGLISVSDWGMIEIGENGVITMGTDSSFTAGAGSTFTIGTQGTGAYLSYADGVLSIEGMLTVTDGADFLPTQYLPAAISASFETSFSSGTTWNFWGALPYGDDGGYVVGRMETADGNIYVLVCADTVSSLASRYIKVAVKKTRLAGDSLEVGSIAYPNTTYLPGSSVVICYTYTDAEWNALSDAERDRRMIIADAYVSADFSEILTMSFRADSAVSVIGPDFIRTANLSALSADLGSVTAGSIVVGTTNKLWLNDDTTSPTVALAIGGSTKASAPFLVYEDGDFHAGGAANNYIDWNGSTLTVKGTIHVDAGYLGSLTVDGNLTMNGGQIRWNSNNSYIDDDKIVIEDTSGYSTMLIGDRAQSYYGVLDITLDAGGDGGWQYGIRLVDGGNTIANTTALYRGVSGISGVAAVDRIFSAASANGSYSDGFYAEMAASNTWADFDTAGVPFKGIHNAGGPVALFNQLGGGADAPVVWMTSGNTNRSIAIAEMGANGQQGFRVIRNGYGASAEQPIIGLNTDGTDVYMGDGTMWFTVKSSAASISAPSSGQAKLYIKDNGGQPYLVIKYPSGPEHWFQRAFTM